MPITARRYYQTDGLGDVPREWVRVTGFKTITVGDGSDGFPIREERWCRVLHEGDRAVKVLMHPSRLDAATGTTECPWGSE